MSRRENQIMLLPRANFWLTATLCFVVSPLMAQEAKAPAAAVDTSFEKPSDPKAVAIVDRYLKAIGGRDVLLAIKDRVSTFRNIKYSATGETVARIALYLKQGYKFREEWEIVGFKIKDEPLAFVQIYNGESLKGWVKMLGTVSPLEGRTLSVFVWDKYLDDFFAHWKENGYSVKVIAEGLVDDETADILEVGDFTGRQKVRYFFSKTSGLLLKKEWMDAAQKDTVKKEQYYRKYRRVAFQDGSGHSINFPLRLEIYLDGDLDTERLYDEVKFNANLSDKLFERPEGKEFVSPLADKERNAAQKKLKEVGLEGSKVETGAARRTSEAPTVKTEGSAPRKRSKVTEGTGEDAPKKE